MLSLHDLSTLIQGLTKSEKRYIALFSQLQGGTKAYWYLYQVLQNEPGDIQQISETFTSRYPASLLEPSRKHLYKVLMKALRSYQAEKSLNRKLMNVFHDIEILFNKGLFTAAFTQIEKAKKMALQHEQFGYYQLVARLELQYLTELEFFQITERDLVARQEQMNEVLYQLLFINKHAAINEVLLHRYFHGGPTRSQRETDQLNDLLLEEYQLNANKRYHSLESAKLHLHFQSIYFLMTGQYEESLKLYQQLEGLFATNPALGEEENVYYTYLINGILTGLRSTRNHQAMQTFLNGLENVDEHSTNPKVALRQLILGHKLGILIDSGKFVEGLQLLEQYPKERSVASHSRALLDFHAAVVYFGLEKYHTALACVNEAFHTQIISVSQSLYSLFRLLNLIIHFELGDDDYLIYELRSLERKLKLQKKLFETEKILIHFFKNHLQRGRRQLSWQTLHQQLCQLQENPFEKQILRSFDFLSWVEAKKQRVSFAHIIQEKQNASLYAE